MSLRSKYWAAWRRPPSRLLLEIDVGERLPVGVADDEAGVGLLDGPGRREAGRGPRWHYFRNRRSRLANFAWFRVSHSQTTSSGS